MADLHYVQGPAGAGKSQHVAALKAAGTVAAIADITRLWSAIGGYERDPTTGLFPVRADADPALLLALYTKTVVVRQALSEGVNVAVTSSVALPAPTLARHRGFVRRALRGHDD